MDKLCHYHDKEIAKPRIYERTLDTAFLNYSKIKVNRFIEK